MKPTTRKESKNVTYEEKQELLDRLSEELLQATTFHEISMISKKLEVLKESTPKSSSE